MKICQFAGCREPATHWAQLWQYYTGILCALHAAKAMVLGIKVWLLDEKGGS